MSRWFKYEPATPCRRDIYGEGIFVECWQRAMREPMEYGDGVENERFECIVSPWGARASDAIAATSFICWLGTNCGRSFLWKVGRLREQNKLDAPDAYALAWVHENTRHGGINHGRVAVEAILPRELINLRSVEMIDITVRWLGTPAGLAMVEAAQVEIGATEKALRASREVQWRAEERARALVGTPSLSPHHGKTP